MLTGGFIYWFAVGSMEDHLSDLHQKQIVQRAHNVDDQLQYLELSLSHWAFDPRFGSNLRELDFVYHFRETWDITKTLVVMQGSHPLIKDVELYIGREQPVLFKTEYYKLADDSVIQSYKDRLSDKRTVYWSTQEEPVLLMHKVPGDSPSPFGALLLTLDGEKLANLLRTMTPYNEGSTMVLDGQGETVIRDGMDDEAAEALRQAVLARETEGGTFLYDSNGATYTVSYGTMRRIQTEWTYISAAPLSTIVSPVIVTSNVILGVSTAGLLAAIVLSWLASNRMYSPVARMLQLLSAEKTGESRVQDEFQYLERKWMKLTEESQSLQERVDRQLPYLRTGFLQQLIQGHLHGFSEQELRERLQRYGWEAAGHRFYMLHIQLTGHGSVSKRFSGDESLVSFSASNIVEELAEQYYESFSVIPLYDLSFGLLVAAPNETDAPDTIRRLSEEMTRVINHIIQMQVTITKGKPTEEVRRIPELFAQVVRYSGFRKFGNQNQWIDMEATDSVAESMEAKYPFALEKDIIQSLRMGRNQEAQKLVAAFLEELLSHRGTEFHVQQSMLQLLGSIRHLILETGIDADRWFEGKGMFEQLSGIREPDKMVLWIKTHLLEPYAQESEARSNAQLKRMVEQTIDYMNHHYMEDISLELCADLAGTTAYTLSKLFKQTTGVNFIDYLTELRIAKAKTLLRESDKKINDIAEAVGYQQSYFNRIFKKQVGVTPGQYREKSGA
ncbi:AraC family transcriptional regulator [Paenibacillus sp. TRM 82003]|nr:AraC family transcriptional regulator [Paenibacillus sp. TRM 82003]